MTTRNYSVLVLGSLDYARDDVFHTRDNIFHAPGGAFHVRDGVFQVRDDSSLRPVTSSVAERS